MAYLRDDQDPATRPVTFAVNGGPGASSAYLNLLAIGPWRLPLEAEHQPIGTAGAACPMPRPGSISPTSCSSIRPAPATAGSSAATQVRERFYSVQGDIDGLCGLHHALAEGEEPACARRNSSRAKAMAASAGRCWREKLQSDLGIGFSGLVLVSPVLDFGWIGAVHARAVGRCGAPAFAWRQRRCRRSQTGDRGKRCRTSENYASGDYLVDLMRGVVDKAAVDRIARRTSELTGLDLALTQRLAGRIDTRTFQREIRAKQGGSGQRLRHRCVERRSQSHIPNPRASTIRFSAR